MRDAVLSLLADIRTMELGISDARRALLAERWTDHALLEHASIASFSRFSLHLLAVAAPADLVERAHRAAIEEIEHARLAFAIASRLGGAASIGPGPLPMGNDVLGSMDLLSITLAATEEGCIGETRAALAADREAYADADHDTPRAIIDVLALIAADEASHADLAFAFVAWACESGGASIAAAVESLRRRADLEVELAHAWPDLLAGSRNVESLLLFGRKAA